MTTLLKATQVAHGASNLSDELVTAADIPLTYTSVWDPASIASGALTTTAVTLTGAVVGDVIIASHTQNLAGLILSAYVSAIDTITVILFNPTAGTVNIASGTLKAYVIRKGV